MTSRLEKAVAPDGQGAQRFLSWLDRSQTLAHMPWYSRWRAVIELWFSAIKRDEVTYARCVEELKEPAVNEAVQHFAMLMVEMHTDPRDILGPIYQEASVNDKKRMAQYFTPNTVAMAMAQMSTADMHRDQFNKPEGLTICEPACGTGVMIIQALRCIHERFGQWGLNRTSVTLIDLDAMCGMMAALQLSWMPWPIGQWRVYQGDTIRNDSYTLLAGGGRGIPPVETRRIRKVI